MAIAANHGRARTSDRGVARHHAAIVDEDHALEPEALLQITEDFGNGVVVGQLPSAAIT